jgi:LruC domain-containing protein
LAPDNSPIKNIPVRILSKAEENGGVVLFKAFTDAAGKITGSFRLPAYYQQVVVDPRYLGILRNAVVSIVNNNLLCTIGGSTGYAGNVIPDAVLGGRPGIANGVIGQRPSGAVISYLGTYNSGGKPNYLEPVNDIISASFLANVNASLPESKPVQTYHPDYLTSNAETNLNIVELSDVWFTFVTEGAGYLNSMGYYTYPTGNPPATANDIDSIKIILPNASLSGSGGQLVSGNKVNIGRFAPGTSIGFVLIANGWNGSIVGNGYHRVYSNDAFNPGTTAANKRQTVLLYDNTQSLFLVGFEDQLRDSPGCDHDFNDCLFYIKSNPVTGISKINVNPIDIPIDTDGDGVNDIYDDFPTDPTRAYINYYPGEKSVGTHTFEDNWPNMGDYDMNDLVVDYRYKVISNALNRPVEMTAQYVLKASGASFKNGFGVQFPFASTLVKSTTGSLVNSSDVVSIGANGCENGQAKAVVIPFDDAYKAMNTTGYFINTFVGKPHLTRDTISMNISFTRPLTIAEFGSAPFNPFIIINRTRGREAHMPGYAPTDKVDARYFKTGDDNTNAAQGIYYKTKTNLPWGINFLENFDYPAEGNMINSVYTKFIGWAQSNGVSSADWYKDAPNTINSKLYKF